MNVQRKCHIRYGPKISDSCDATQLTSMMTGGTNDSKSVAIEHINITNNMYTAYCYIATVSNGTHKIEIEGTFHTGIEL